MIFAILLIIILLNLSTTIVLARYNFIGLKDFGICLGLSFIPIFGTICLIIVAMIEVEIIPKLYNFIRKK